MVTRISYGTAEHIAMYWISCADPERANAGVRAGVPRREQRMHHLRKFVERACSFCKSNIHECNHRLLHLGATQPLGRLLHEHIHTSSSSSRVRREASTSAPASPTRSCLSRGRGRYATTRSSLTQGRASHEARAGGGRPVGASTDEVDSSSNCARNTDDREKALQQALRNRPGSIWLVSGAML